jgi:hypothetical protein
MMNNKYLIPGLLTMLTATTGIPVLRKSVAYFQNHRETFLYRSLSHSYEQTSLMNKDAGNNCLITCASNHVCFHVCYLTSAQRNRLKVNQAAEALRASMISTNSNLLFGRWSE